MKKFKYILILIILSSIVNYSTAQNLVPNPSFETYTSCPNAASQISLANPWQGPVTNSSDYFNVCGSGSTTVPVGGGGFQYARSGDAYAGIWAINPYGYNYREYLRILLNSNLQPDSCYYIEFYCNLNNISRYGINKMGAYISNSISNIVGPGSVLQNTPQIVSDTFLNDTLDWMRVSGYYHALGGEQYITIGNFSADSTTDTIHVGGTYPGAYYLIDDVSVTKISACDTTSTSIHEQADKSPFDLFPNPNNGNMTLKYSINANDIAFIQITDITGKQIARYSVPASTNAVQINEQLENGIYIYHIIVNNKPVKSDKLLIIK